MIIIPPIDVLPGQLTGATSAESQFLPWSAGTTYAIAVITSDFPLEYANAAAAVVTYNHRDYESKQAGNINHVPDISPDHWLDIGVANRYRMFEYEDNLPTFGASPMVVPVVLNRRVDSVMLFDPIADAVQLEVVTPGADPQVIFDSGTVTLSKRFTSRMYEYFYGSFTRRRKYVFLNLPPISGATIRLTLTRATGEVSLGAMCIGMAVQAGKTNKGVQSRLLDFSQIKRSERGRIKLNKGKNIPLLNLQTNIRKTDVDRMLRLREDYSSKPLVFLGNTDPTDGYFDAMAVLGIFKDMPILLEYAFDCYVSYEIEGL